MKENRFPKKFKVGDVIYLNDGYRNHKALIIKFHKSFSKEISNKYGFVTLTDDDKNKMSGLFLNYGTYNTLDDLTYSLSRQDYIVIGRINPETLKTKQWHFK